MNAKNLLLTLLIVFCVAFSAYRLFLSGSPGAAQRRDLADELAACVAKEASAAGKGKVLILAPLDEKRDPFPGQLARSAEKHMKSAGFEPVEVERVPYNPAHESTGEPVAHEAFLQLVRAHDGAKVVLSLVGVPRLTENDLPAATRPRIIVATVVKMPYLGSLPRGLIDFSIEAKRKWTEGTADDPALGKLNENFVLRRYAK